MQIWKSGIWIPEIPDSRFPDLQTLCFRIPGFQIPDFQKSGIWKPRPCKSGNLESGNLGPANLESGISGSLGRANLEIWNLETYVLQKAGNQEIQTLETSRRRFWGGGGGASIYIYIYALRSGATTPPMVSPPPHPPMAPTPATPATPPSPCCCADLPLLQIGAQRNLCGSSFPYQT